jgi:hypothetical protein
VTLRIGSKDVQTQDGCSNGNPSDEALYLVQETSTMLSCPVATATRSAHEH